MQLFTPWLALSGLPHRKWAPCWVWSCAHCYQECCFGAFCMLPACSCWNEGRSRVL